MRISLMSYAIRRVIWIVGFGLMLVTFGLQATALRFGELSVVQPVLTTELLFLLLILGGWFRYRLGWQEWLGAAWSSWPAWVGSSWLPHRDRRERLPYSHDGWWLR